MSPLLPTRQVHLDFHTGPAIGDVGAEFDANEFARVLSEARVNSVTLFAKCHHGHLYYDTDRPERHPGLARSLDLLGEQIEACRSRGIRTPIYISVQCDEYAANMHPEWLCRNPDGTTVGRKPLSNDPFAWQILDMSSPYAAYLEEQTVEIVGRFRPVDGVFFDMCWDQPSVSRYAVDGMRRSGLEPANADDRARYARSVSVGYMERLNSVVARVNGSLPRVWYNSRPKTNLASEAKYLKHIEIEALPTGGWGYTYFPLNVRWARNFGLPFIGMTARFHKSWSDFGGYKPDAALKYELSQMIAHGGGCSVGDQLHPRGRLDPEAYRLIGEAYAHVEACEAVCLGTTPATEVAVLREVAGEYAIQPGGTYEGVVRLLQQLAVQFDLLAPEAGWDGYRVVIVPEGVRVGETLSAKLEEFAARGGRVVLAGPGAIRSALAGLRQIAGVAASEDGLSRTPFVRLDPALVAGAPKSEVVLYDGSLYLTPAAGASVPGRLVDAYFDRSWDRFSGHNQTPPERESAFAAVTMTERGAAIGFDVFRSYGTHGQVAVRRLFAAVMSKLLPRPLLRAQVPTHVELTVARGNGKTLVHVLSYAPQRRTPTLDLVEEATPMVNAEIALRWDGEGSPKSVRRWPGGEPLGFEVKDGYVAVRLTGDRGHDVLEVA